MRSGQQRTQIVGEPNIRQSGMTYINQILKCDHEVRVNCNRVHHAAATLPAGLREAGKKICDCMNAHDRTYWSQNITSRLQISRPKQNFRVQFVVANFLFTTSAEMKWSSVID